MSNRFNRGAQGAGGCQGRSQESNAGDGEVAEGCAMIWIGIYLVALGLLLAFNYGAHKKGRGL